MIPDDFKKYVTIQDAANIPNGWTRTWHTVKDGKVSKPTVQVALDEQGSAAPSWSKGRTKGLTSVSICHNGKRYVLHGNVFSSDPDEVFNNEFWQSDDYLSVVGGNQTRRIKRRIQMKLDDGWLTLEVWVSNGDHKIYLSPKRI